MATSRKWQSDPYIIANTTQIFVATSLRTKTYQVPDDFTPIARLVTEPTAVVVKGDSPYNSIDDLIKAAKANPGQIKWAGGNVGSKNQVLVEMTQKAGNCKFTYIPFDGDNQARAAVMGEHVTAATNQVRDVVSLVKAGELKILAVAGEERIGLAPDVPTYREAGYDVVLVQSRGVVAPAGISDAAKKYLGEKFKLICETPGIQEVCIRLRNGHGLSAA